MLFFELIRVALGAQEQLTSCPSSSEWTELFVLAQKQTLVGICFSGIEKLPPEQRPPKELLLQWWALTRKIEERNLIMDQRTAFATKYFRSNGFKTAILKGQGIAKLYPKPERRQSGDIDIWLDGGRKRIYNFARRNDPEGKLEGVNYHHVHYHLFDDTEVEVHIYPAYLHNPFLNRRLHRFFETYPQTENPTPSMAFNRVFILLHSYNHLLGHGVGLRQVMDYYFVLKSRLTPVPSLATRGDSEKVTGSSQDAEKEAVEWIRELGMLRFAKATMWVMQEVFGLEKEYMFVEPDEKEGCFLLEEIFQTGNMGHYEKRNWGSLDSPLSRFFYNLRRDWHFISHYPQEVLWQPWFSIWMNVKRLFWKR